MLNYLGIDYGTKRIGLALNAFKLAEPLFVLENQITPEKPIVSDDALSKIAALCQEKKIEQIVLGISEAQMAEKIRIFANLLKEKIDLPIVLMDETLSSYEVGSRMKEAGFSLKKRQGPIDHYSAALILEDYLETLPD